MSLWKSRIDGHRIDEKVFQHSMGIIDGLELMWEQHAARISMNRAPLREDHITEIELGSEDESELAERPREDVRWIAPFLACGDLSAFDADASHKLPEGYQTLDPVQPPTAPPYRKALEERKKMGGAYGKTKLGEIK